MSSRGTSTLSRTLLSGSSSTWTATRPFKQRSFNCRRGAQRLSAWRTSGGGLGEPGGSPSLYRRRVRLFVMSRHAESVLNHQHRINGDPSVPAPLTEHGREEAALLGLQVRSLPLDVCLHTRFGRTVETAQIAIDGRDVPI